jgi:hypothetical protein
MRRWVLVAIVCSSVGRARADDALDAVYDRIAVDAKAGRPIVAEVHVGLCENRILRCGGHGLGDGDDPDRNLYWGTSGGLRGWMGRNGSGWKRVAEDRGDGERVLEQIIWRRTVAPDGALRVRGVTKPFSLYVVARAWRGVKMDLAIAAYAEDLLGAQPRAAPPVEGVDLPTGGRAHLVAYVGHNRWMDRPDFRFPARDPASPKKATIAVACYSAAYLGRVIDAAGDAPILLTKDFLFAGSHAMDGALRAFAAGASLESIRVAGANAYADGERKTFAHVQSAFVNAGDRRWAAAIRE